MTVTAHRSVYDFTTDRCDVRDTSRLTEFRAKRDEWLHWLLHDELHAISKQISSMLWSDAVFRLINQSRKLAHEAGGEFATQSGVLARALDNGYVAEQLIAFRKLLEKPAPKNPKRQVISLRRLIDDVREHRELLTREMFVCYDGLPFDDRGGMDDLPEPNEHGVSIAWVSTSGPRAFGMANLQHTCFSKFMDSAPPTSDRDDQIGARFFAEIENALSKAPFERARLNANKILLHAADGFSRGAQPIPSMTLQDNWDCHRAILMTVNRISVVINGPNLGGVPTPQYDVLENWSTPFAPMEGFDAIMEEWQLENIARERWTNELFE